MKKEYIVAAVDDLPEGGHLVVTAGNREFGIFNVQGEMYALPNVCFHQNGPLCRGKVSGTVVCNAETGWQHTWVQDGEVIVCPWHSLEFNITTGQCLAYPQRRLPMYEVQVVGGQIKLIV